MIKKIFILFFFLNACGYQPLYVSKKEIVFKNIVFLGDKKINRKVISLSSIKKDPENTINNELILQSSQKIIATSKDTTGQAASYRTEVEIILTIKIDDKKEKEKRFIQVFNYNNIENKSDLSNYQKDVENNLINKIVEDLIIYMNL
tara:strand:- start:476 stop:916 length:441 start_codon:yes stop_codon:yes gene_type:complete